MYANGLISVEDLYFVRVHVVRAMHSSSLPSPHATRRSANCFLFSIRCERIYYVNNRVSTGVYSYDNFDIYIYIWHFSSWRMHWQVPLVETSKIKWMKSGAYFKHFKSLNNSASFSSSFALCRSSFACDFIVFFAFAAYLFILTLKYAASWNVCVCVCIKGSAQHRNACIFVRMLQLKTNNDFVFSLTIVVEQNTKNFCRNEMFSFYLLVLLAAAPVPPPSLPFTALHVSSTHLRWLLLWANWMLFMFIKHENFHENHIENVIINCILWNISYTILLRNISPTYTHTHTHTPDTYRLEWIDL